MKDKRAGCFYTYGSTLLVRGSVKGVYDPRPGDAWKDVGTVIIEGDGSCDFVLLEDGIGFGTAGGIGGEFVQELADSGLPCYFGTVDYCHAAGKHTWENGICIGCGEMENSDLTGSVLSDGNLWIVIAIAVVALGGVAALLIVKKKKKPVTADAEKDAE